MPKVLPACEDVHNDMVWWKQNDGDKAAIANRETILAEAFNTIVAVCHVEAAQWWVDPHTGDPKDRNYGEMIALAHSELSESLEGYRKSLQDDKLPQYPMWLVELIDTVIRLGDTIGGLSGDINPGQVFVDKIMYNDKRVDHKHENRVLPGGKHSDVPIEITIGTRKATQATADDTRFTMLLWGMSGCGKSTLASTAPGDKFWVQFDPNALRPLIGTPENEHIVSLDLSGEPHNIVEQFKSADPMGIERELKKHPSIKTLVFDSATSYATLGTENAVFHVKSANIENPGMKGYGHRNAVTLAAITNLQRVCKRLGLNFIIIAHEDTPDKDEQGNIIQITLMLGGKMANTLGVVLDEVWWISSVDAPGGEVKRMIAVRPIRKRTPVKTRMFDPSMSQFEWVYDAQTSKGMRIDTWIEEWQKLGGEEVTYQVTQRYYSNNGFGPWRVRNLVVLYYSYEPLRNDEKAVVLKCLLSNTNEVKEENGKQTKTQTRSETGDRNRSRTRSAQTTTPTPKPQPAQSIGVSETRNVSPTTVSAPPVVASTSKGPTHTMSSILEFSADISTAEAPPPLPAGEYVGTIEKAERRTANTSGNELLSLGIRIPADAYPIDFVDGDEEGTMLYYQRTVLGDTATLRYRLRRVADACGVHITSRLDDEKIGEFVGRPVRVMVSNSEYEGEPRAQIDRLLPA